jgi:hypothetical protein
MFKFRCSKCNKDTYHPSQRLAECCEGAVMAQLVNICLVLPKDKAPTHKVIGKNPESFVLDLVPGQEWVTACNASTKPRVTTPIIEASTCYKCNQWLEANKKTNLARQELGSLEEFMKTIDFEDEEDPQNSFKAQIEGIKKELPTSDIPTSVEDIDKLLTKIQEFSTMLKQRKTVRNQLELEQELRTL